jgi:hypothetical protein
MRARLYATGGKKFPMKALLFSKIFFQKNQKIWYQIWGWRV